MKFPSQVTILLALLLFRSQDVALPFDKPRLIEKLSFHYIAGLPRSMPNADQCWSMPIKILALIPMSINSDQCRSIPFNADQCRSMQINARSSRIDWQFLLCFTDALIRHWLALIGNDRHWETFWINAMILIGIDRHWVMGVLILAVACVESRREK